MRVDFYHLTHDPLPKLVASLASRCTDAGERLLILVSEDQYEAISRALWSHSETSFLAHERQGCELAEKLPILLGDQADAANGARHVLVADGQWREQLSGFERIFWVFDQDNIDSARNVWRTLADNKTIKPRYWKQQGRKWVEGP